AAGADLQGRTLDLSVAAAARSGFAISFVARQRRASLPARKKLTGASQRGLHASAMLLPHSDCLGERGTGMTFHRPWVCLGARLAAIAVTALLCACAGERDLPAEPSFYQSLATKDAQVDAAMAASMISGYRSNNGLTAVTLDPELMKLAEAQAQAMASRD